MSDDERLGPLLHGTARAWRLKLDQRLKPMGLSQAKWRTLLHLSLAGDALTQAEIAERLGIEQPSLVTLTSQPCTIKSRILNGTALPASAKRVFKTHKQNQRSVLVEPPDR